MSRSVGLFNFSSEVLSVSRRRTDWCLRRTHFTGRLETPRWSLHFRLCSGDTLQLSERELWRLEPAEAAHWNSFRLADGAPGRHWLCPGEAADGPERPWD